MAQYTYKLTDNEDVITRIEDGAPISKGHRFWKDYELFLAEGNTPTPARTDEEASTHLYNLCNGEAARRINTIMPDWMERRHREQTQLVARGKRPATKIPQAIYELKQEQCDAVRDASDTISDWIEEHADPASVADDDILNHAVWP